VIELLDPFNLAGAGHKAVRQSMLGQADVCNMRLAFDREHGGGWSEPRIVGTGYHGGLAEFYVRHFDDPFPDMGIINAATEVAFVTEVDAAKAAGHVLEWDKFGSMSAALAGAQAMTKYYLDIRPLKPEHYRVLGIEVPFWFPLGGEWIAHGTIDLVLEDLRDGTHWLRDHKTAGRPWKKGKESARANNQPAWYLAFWPHLYALVHQQAQLPITRFAFDVMTYDMKFETRIADRNAAHIQRVFDKATLVATLLDNDGPWYPNTDHFLCDKRWCDHWERCKFGEGYDNDAAPLQITPRSQA